MKASAVVVAVFLWLVFVFGTTLARADSVSDLCAILNKGRADLAVAERRTSAESNPLKQATLQHESSRILEQVNASLDRFFKANNRRINNYTGVVSNIHFHQYTEGPGVGLTIDLPCRVTISFKFIDRNPAWGDPRPREYERPLSEWRKALESLALKDSVSFSGNFYFGTFNTYPIGRSDGVTGALRDRLLLEGVLTELKKGGMAFSNSGHDREQRFQDSRKPTRKIGEYQVRPCTNPLDGSLDRTASLQLFDVGLQFKSACGSFVTIEENCSIWFGRLNDIEVRNSKVDITWKEKRDLMVVELKGAGTPRCSVIAFAEDNSRSAFVQDLRNAMKEWHVRFGDVKDWRQ